MTQTMTCEIPQIYFQNYYKVLFLPGGGICEEYRGSLRNGKQENLLDILLLPHFKIDTRSSSSFTGFCPKLSIILEGLVQFKDHFVTYSRTTLLRNKSQ